MSAQEKAELCEAMIPILEERGLAEGQYENSEGQVCRIGAAFLARGMKPSYCRFHQEIISTATQALGLGVSSRVFMFNDQYLRGNTEEAISFLTKKAKYWREQG